MRIKYILAFVNGRVVPEQAMGAYWRVALHSPNTFTPAVMLRLPAALVPAKQPAVRRQDGTKSQFEGFASVESRFLYRPVRNEVTILTTLSQSYTYKLT